MAEGFNYELHVFKLPDLESMVGKALAFFEKTPVLRLPPPRFIGCGVYALYYLGDFEPYITLSRLNREAYTRPIYVGKAVPRGVALVEPRGRVQPDCTAGCVSI